MFPLNLAPFTVEDVLNHQPHGPMTDYLRKYHAPDAWLCDVWPSLTPAMQQWIELLLTDKRR